MVIGNNFYNDYYNLSVDFVNYFAIYFGNYCLVCYSSIYYKNYSLIDCSGNSGFGCLNNFYSDYWSSFYSYCMTNFVIDCLGSNYFLIGN